MEENKEQLDEVKLSSPILTKLENFWYHYKWHTVAAVFALAVLIICLVQCSKQVEYDIHIVYAGGETFSRRSEGGDVPRYNKMVAGLEQFADDYDGKHGVNVSFSDLFIPSPEEQESLGSNLDYSSMREDIKIFNERSAVSEYYIYFVSKHVYDNYRMKSDVDIFAPIKKYCPEGNDFEFEGENAVYLASTDLYLLEPFSSLPEDTLICIRINTDISSAFNKRKNAEYYRRAEEYLTALLAYTHPASS